jgi:antitoxin component YwqK of YwqJK toxin-antitoxin module
MSTRIEEKYYPDGKLETRLYYNEKNELHREDGPAEERFYTSGKICSRRWYFEGKLHRENGPAVEILHFIKRPVSIYYYLNGKHLSISEHRRQVMLQKLTAKIATDCEVRL